MHIRGRGTIFTRQFELFGFTRVCLKRLIFLPAESADNPCMGRGRIQRFGSLLVASLLVTGCLQTNVLDDRTPSAAEGTPAASPAASPLPSPKMSPSASPKPSPSASPKPSPSASPKPPLSAGTIHLWKRNVSYETRYEYDAAVFLPATYGSSLTAKFPLVLSLHGLGGSTMDVDHTAVGGKKEGFIKQVWGTELAKTYPAVVIAPNARPPGSTTDVWWQVSLTKKLLKAALVEYRIDPKRIVVTGLSAGGSGTFDLIRDAEGRSMIAAAMPGAFHYPTTQEAACKLADLPVWVFGNSSDSIFQPANWRITAPLVPNCANFIDAFRLDIYQSTCGHGCWDAHWAKPEVQQWLIQQSRP